MRSKVIFGILLLGIVFSACDKLLEVDPPANEIDLEEAFNDSSSAVAAVAGIYNQMVWNANFECSGVSFNTAHSADEVYTGLPSDHFGLNAVDYSHVELLDMWKEGFSSLLMINTCIEGLQSTQKLPPALHRQLLGESLFCRAFVNFYLVNCWGNAIPLITTPDVEKNHFAESVPQQWVYDLIIADLLQAKELLVDNYPSVRRARPNLMAANALLARVYLYQRRYEDAIVQANTVIGNTMYSPLPAPGAAFLLTSRETIWQLMPPVGGVNSGAVQDATMYKNNYVQLRPQLLAAFEQGDLRRQSWVTNYTFGLDTFTTVNKYKDKGRSGNTTPTEYYIILRLAEQYLIRAEANALLGRLPAAIADLNIIRSRAGLSPLPSTLTQVQCMMAVEQERRIELFTEWGHRWFDLKRWTGFSNINLSRADEVLGAFKPDWQSTDQWYPVPKLELQVNPNLVQNPGYPSR